MAEAMRHPYHWATNFTKTYNEHWIEEQRPSAFEAFPRWPFLEPLFELFLAERIVWLEKSRDMLVSWSCVAYLLWEAMRIPHRGVVFQTQKEKKVEKLISYAKCLYREQPAWLKDAFPLAKPLAQQSVLSLEWANGSYVVGIPGGADQIRSLHPFGYLNDETSFQADAGECYNEALSVCKGKIILNSSAGPSWYADVRKDIVLIEEE